jgi:hypothetical protein
MSRAVSWVERGHLLRATENFAGVAVGFAARQACCRIIPDSVGRGQLLAGWPDASVASLIVGDALARECPAGTRRFIEHLDVRLDRPLVYEPTQHIRRPAGAVGRDAFGRVLKAFSGGFYCWRR